MRTMHIFRKSQHLKEITSPNLVHSPGFERFSPVVYQD